MGGANLHLHGWRYIYHLSRRAVHLYRRCRIPLGTILGLLLRGEPQAPRYRKSASHPSKRSYPAVTRVQFGITIAISVPASNRLTFPQLEELESEGWLRLLLRELGRTNTHHITAKPTAETDIKRQVGQAIRYLELQYTQAVSIEHLARSLGYHRTYLCKMFKQSTGLSPMQYLFNIRMERAKQLLANRHDDRSGGLLRRLQRCALFLKAIPQMERICAFGVSEGIRYSLSSTAQ